MDSKMPRCEAWGFDLVGQGLGAFSQLVPTLSRVLEGGAMDSSAISIVCTDNWGWMRGTAFNM